jgi:polyisoprenoid-binding protein YceI
VVRNIVIVVGVLVLIALAAGAYAVFRPPQEASAPIAAPTLIVEAAPPASAVTVAEPTPTLAPVEAQADAPTPAFEPTATDEPAAEPTEAPEPEPTEAPTPEPTAAPVEEPPVAAATGPTLFEIVQAESQARFFIDEVLRGNPVRVLGVTDQVAGQLAVDPANPTAAQVGTILVNARTLTTDNESRNRAIKNQILRTDTFEYITFEPTELIGLPDSATVGQSFEFQIAGNLTIRDRTLPVTFDVTLTPASETRLEGLARTVVRYADFGIAIPNVPSVTGVDENVTLEMEFVAVAP